MRLACSLCPYFSFSKHPLPYDEIRVSTDPLLPGVPCFPCLWTGFVEHAERWGREQELNIYTKLSLTPVEQAQLVEACCVLMDALGYALRAEGNVIVGSFWKRLWFVLRSNISFEELNRAVGLTKKALELKHVDVPSAEQTEKLASAARQLIDSLEKIKGPAAIRLGILLVIKYEQQEQYGYLVHQLSLDQMRVLAMRPSLIQNQPLLHLLINSDDFAQKCLNGIEE